MSEEELKERKVETPGENGDGAAVPSEGEPPETEIRDTDIVFDCPHCGHNLAIDYRGAGLQINCVNCGESVLVPIPDGMKIDDLDLWSSTSSDNPVYYVQYAATRAASVLRNAAEMGIAEPDPATVDLEPREVRVRIDLKAGAETATVWTNDLTHAYVHENSAYSS